MRTEEADRLKDKLHFLSLNSFKSNLVESVMLTHKDRLRSKGKKNQKPNHPRQQNKSSNNIQKPKGSCYACIKLGHKAY